MANERVFGKRTQIIAVETDVETSAGDRAVFNSKNIGSDYTGDGNTAAQDTDKTQIFHAFVFFCDFVRYPHQSTPDGGVIHDLGF